MQSSGEEVAAHLPANRFPSDRAELGEFVTFVGP
jgi:hypothetical protein